SANWPRPSLPTKSPAIARRNSCHAPPRKSPQSGAVIHAPPQKKPRHRGAVVFNSTILKLMQRGPLSLCTAGRTLIGIFRMVRIIRRTWPLFFIVLRLRILITLLVIIPHLTVIKIMPCLRDRRIPLLLQRIDLLLPVAMRKRLIMLHILDLSFVIALDPIDLL